MKMKTRRKRNVEGLEDSDIEESDFFTIKMDDEIKQRMKEKKMKPRKTTKTHRIPRSRTRKGQFSFYDAPQSESYQRGKCTLDQFEKPEVDEKFDFYSQDVGLRTKYPEYTDLDLINKIKPLLSVKQRNLFIHKEDLNRDELERIYQRKNEQVEKFCKNLTWRSLGYENPQQYLKNSNGRYSGDGQYSQKKKKRKIRTFIIEQVEEVSESSETYEEQEPFFSSRRDNHQISLHRETKNLLRKYRQQA